MRFEHSHHEETHGRVGKILGELFEAPYLDEDNAHFYVAYGSTVLEISVEPYGPEEITVEVTAYCVQGLDLSEDLLLGLLELNHTLPVGAFSLVGKDLFFSSRSSADRSIARTFSGRSPPWLMSRTNTMTASSRSTAARQRSTESEIPVGAGNAQL